MSNLSTFSKKKWLIVNWKTYLTAPASWRLAKRFLSSTALVNSLGRQRTRLVVCPPLTALGGMKEILQKSSQFRRHLFLGAQDVFWQLGGPYTGTVSADDLRALGCQYCLVGHSERRRWFQENNTQLRQKIILLYQEGLTPVLCIGETYRQYQQGKRRAVLKRQLRDVLEGISWRRKHILIAYEPVWAIHPSPWRVEPAEMREVAAFLREQLDNFIKKHGGSYVLLYGGSVKPGDVQQWLLPGLISGVLVGHAATNLSSWQRLVKAVSEFNFC